MPSTGTEFLRARLEAAAGGGLFLNAKALAREMGCSLRTLRRHELEGKVLEPIRMGRTKKWAITEVVAWIEAGCPNSRNWAWMRRRAA